MAFYQNLKTYNPARDPDYYEGKASWIASRLVALRRDLFETITRDRQPNSLIVGSWNIRAFDDGIPRLDESYHYLAEVISNFDVMAIQEIKADLWPLKRLVKLLGPDWDFFVSDVSTGKGGNNERMAFVYNTDRVFFRNLIGEIVLPRNEEIEGEQIARSPFFAAFQAGWFRFTLCSAHIVFGGASKLDKELRAKEISAIAKTLVKRAKKEDQVYIFLGDMNIDEPGGPIMAALTGSGMVVPEFPATNLRGNKHYDQIAFTVKGKATRKTRHLRAGSFDWRKAVYGPWPDKEFPDASEIDASDPTRRLTDQEQLDHYEQVALDLRARHGKGPYKDWKKAYEGWTTFEMSDHLPLWVELEIDYSEQYLRGFIK